MTPSTSYRCGMASFADILMIFSPPFFSDFKLLKLVDLGLSPQMMTMARRICKFALVGGCSSPIVMDMRLMWNSTDHSSIKSCFEILGLFLITDIQTKHRAPGLLKHPSMSHGLGFRV